ncbi:GSCOCG00006854001-RA-CDS [Cotesia congregata]|nr:GSCOCG00006854001-RA-CDS [Cotesia congregata]
MIFVASSCIIVFFTIIITTIPAIFTSPAPDYLHSLANYDFPDFGKKSPKRNESNQVSQRYKSRNDESPHEEQTMYVIEFESEPRERGMNNGNKDGDHDLDVDKHSPLDPWSIVWYIGSFGGLVAFFLIVSCSEWCCRRGARTLGTPYGVPRTGEAVNSSRGVTETPPPPYHLFAPPPYDSVNYADLVDKASGEKLNIYVISVPVQSNIPVQPPTA